MNQDEDEDTYLYGDPTQAAKPVGESNVPSAPKTADQEMEPASEEGEVDDDEEEEDSDIEFVIETEPGKRAAPPPSAQPFASRITTQSRPIATIERAAPSANQIKAETSVAAPPPPVEGVEIDKVAEYNSQPLFNVDLESIEDKSWRKPGADVTDYFNYGFDEFTWTAYCAKQTNLRNEFNPAKVMGMMTAVPPEMQAMMANFPMTPDMMFAMGMMPDPTAFGQGFGGGFGQPPTGPAGQQNFGGGYGAGFVPPQQQQQPPQQGYGGQQYGGQQQQQQQQNQQQQLQPPRYPGQRIGSPTRIGSPNTSVNIPSGPQAMSGQQGYWGNPSSSMRGAPRGGPRRGY